MAAVALHRLLSWELLDSFNRWVHILSKPTHERRNCQGIARRPVSFSGSSSLQGACGKISPWFLEAFGEAHPRTSLPSGVDLSPQQGQKAGLHWGTRRMTDREVVHAPQLWSNMEDCRGSWNPRCFRIKYFIKGFLKNEIIYKTSPLKQYFMSVLIRCFCAERFLAQLPWWDPSGSEQCWAMLQIAPGRQASPHPNSDPGPVLPVTVLFTRVVLRWLDREGTSSPSPSSHT